ncbi:MAG: helix-turn-helix domain-containing protein [Acutalibacteraceae bacterium]
MHKSTAHTRAVFLFTLLTPEYSFKLSLTDYRGNKQLGMSYQNFNRMINNQTKSIRYENIETICLLLNCTPNDLFEITEE